MHPCLCVNEILTLIARELIAARGGKTAVALACCCKGFEDLVLDVLWESQVRLIPLLQTLPEDVWSPPTWDVSVMITVLVASSLNCFNRKFLSRPPTKQEWDRLWKYAQKVRRLYLPALPPQVLSVLQPRALRNSLFPNLKTLTLWRVCDDSIPFIPLVLSTKTATIHFEFSEIDLHTITVASTISAFPTLCPNLREICLNCLPRDPMITDAVSELLLKTNQRTLRHFRADSPLTEEAYEVIRKHPDLRTLQIVVDSSAPLPTIVLPNLINLDIEYSNGHDWLQGFSGASLEKLVSLVISSKSASDNFPEAFGTVALTTSIPTTLSALKFKTRHPWRPIYRSLLPFTQLKNLVIESSCHFGCSSTIDDDTVTDLARAMPKLKQLQLGNNPCKTPGGVTVKGLVALAHHCSHLLDLTIHFQAASLDPPEMPWPRIIFGSTIPQPSCPLRILNAGWIRVPEESMLMVVLTLLRIFPRLAEFRSFDMGSENASAAIRRSKQLIRCFSRKYLFVALRSNTDDPSSGTGAMV